MGLFSRASNAGSDFARSNAASISACNLFARAMLPARHARNKIGSIEECIPVRGSSRLSSSISYLATSTGRAMQWGKPPTLARKILLQAHLRASQPTNSRVVSEFEVRVMLSSIFADCRSKHQSVVQSPTWQRRSTKRTGTDPIPKFHLPIILEPPSVLQTSRSERTRAKALPAKYLRHEPFSGGQRDTQQWHCPKVQPIKASPCIPFRLLCRATYL